jgi:hypothetical protein
MSFALNSNNETLNRTIELLKSDDPQIVGPYHYELLDHIQRNVN